MKNAPKNMNLEKMRKVLSFYGVKEGLRQFTVEITQKCNSRCIFCSSGSSPETDKHEIPLDKVKKLIDFAKSKGLKTINYSGGEPFVHPHLKEIIEHSIEKGLKVNVYTSGNIKKQDFEKVANAGFSPKDLNFTFNYQSSNEKVFQDLTDSKPFSTAIVHYYMKKLMDRKYNVNAHMVPNKMNIDTLHSSVEYLKKLGLSQVSLLRMVAQERALENKDSLALEKDPYIRPDYSRPNDSQEDCIEVPNMPKKIVSILKDVKELQEPNFRVKVGVPFDSFIGDGHICEAGLNKMVVRFDGEVFPCEAFKGDGIQEINPWLKLGNIYKDPLDDIYENGMYAFCGLRHDTTSYLLSSGVWGGYNSLEKLSEEQKATMKNKYKDDPARKQCPMNDFYIVNLAMKFGIKGRRD